MYERRSVTRMQQRGLEDENPELVQPGSNLEEDVNDNEENENVQQDDRRTSCLRHRKSAAEVPVRFSVPQTDSAPSPHARNQQEKEKREREGNG